MQNQFPRYAHVGLILNEDGKKMSKRDKAEILCKAIIAKLVGLTKSNKQKFIKNLSIYLRGELIC